MTEAREKSGDRIGVVGVGEMGLAMTGHLLDEGFVVTAFDLDDDRLAAAGLRGADTVHSTDELAGCADIFMLMVATDDQVREVARCLASSAARGSVIVVAATVSPQTVTALGSEFAPAGLRVVDAPVVYGSSGARAGTLLSLCGGAEDDLDRVRPALMAYSREVIHVGPLGAGQLAKACNNLLHWVHCIANFETLLIAKRYGLDAQRMREVLLECPGSNGTLRRWDTTRFTWQEKDMDLVLDLAQRAGLVLPLTGQIDQLVKRLSAADVKALLYGDEVTYLGQTVRGLSAEQGGLGPAGHHAA